MSSAISDTQPGVSLPTVTVVTPLHNHEQYIERAINSVVAQDYPDLQMIIINDGSTDDGSKVVQQIIGEDKGLIKAGYTIIEGEVNRGSHFVGDRKMPVTLIDRSMAMGPSNARNTGIKEMMEKTHLFCMLDADDYYLEGKISKSVPFFLMLPEIVGLVYSDAIIENLGAKTRVHEFREPFSRHRLEQDCIISNTPMISKFALMASGLYDEQMRTAEDWDLWLRITDNFLAIHIPEPLHVYSVTGQNASDTVPKEIWQQNWQLIHQRIMSRYAQ